MTINQQPASDTAQSPDDGDGDADAAEAAARRGIQNRAARVAAVSAVVVTVVVLFGSYGAKWSWTGFQDNDTLWDWLHLLVLPVSLSLLSFGLKTNKVKRVPWHALVAFFACFAVLALGGYAWGWTWTGFSGNLLWDWLRLLLLPVVVVLTPYWIRLHPRARRWWLLAAVGATVALVVLIIGGYGFGWSWTGFSSNKLWDWLQLLLVPVVVPLSIAWLVLYVEGPDQDQAADQDEPADQDQQALALTAPATAAPEGPTSGDRERNHPWR